MVATDNSVIHTHDMVSGIPTHLGRFKLDAGEDVDLATGAITNGFLTFTGPHGDTISGVYSGHALPGLTGYLVSGAITGGSGRFAGATGCLAWKGTLDPVALTFTNEIIGTISVNRPEGKDSTRHRWGSANRSSDDCRLAGLLLASGQRSRHFGPISDS
jgi:hypothetical protein